MTRLRAPQSPPRGPQPSGDRDRAYEANSYPFIVWNIVQAMKEKSPDIEPKVWAVLTGAGAPSNDAAET